MRASRRNFLTITYHDIFDYPLTEAELLKWELGSGKVDKRSLTLHVKELGSGKVHKTQGYYHLHGRLAIVKLRKEREKESTRKLKLARKVAGKLSIIPTIKFIGVTGSLAMNNAKRESDIDLMIITTSSTLWTTRLIVYLVTKLQSYRVRGVGGEEAKDAICFNMWLDEKHLAIPPKMRNLYSAHEVLQIAPLLNRDHTFERFLAANSWALDFWPKVVTSDKKQVTSKDKNFSFFEPVTCYLLRLTERVAYRAQRLYMHRHRTRETIEPGRAFFHPVDWGKIVMREFNKRLNETHLYRSSQSPIKRT